MCLVSGAKSNDGEAIFTQDGKVEVNKLSALSRSLVLRNLVLSYAPSYENSSSALPLNDYRPII